MLFFNCCFIVTGWESCSSKIGLEFCAYVNDCTYNRNFNTRLHVTSLYAFSTPQSSTLLRSSPLLYPWHTVFQHKSVDKSFNFLPNHQLKVKWWNLDCRWVFSGFAPRRPSMFNVILSTIHHSRKQTQHYIFHSPSLWSYLWDNSLRIICAGILYPNSS